VCQPNFGGGEDLRGWLGVIGDLPCVARMELEGYRLQTLTLLKVLNVGDYAQVLVELMDWVFGGGKKLPGLVTRRTAEAALFEA
jgi:hypothetical protein